MGRTENPTDRLEASRGHRHWAKEIGPNQPLFRVDHGVRPKNNLTEPALLEMSGNRVYRSENLESTDDSRYVGLSTRSDRFQIPSAREFPRWCTRFSPTMRLSPDIDSYCYSLFCWPR